MISAIGYGILSGISILIGAVFGLYLKPSSKWIAACMAFGSGVLFSALSIDLMNNAFDQSQSPLNIGIGFITGALIFIVGDYLLDQKGGFFRRHTKGLQAIKSGSLPDNSNSGTEYTTLENADRYPLFYELPAAANSYTHEIYIPESRLIDAQSDMDNVPCLVVGGYYGAGNTTKETYYRADFATYHNGSVTAYKPILRNHRYVFDIKSVNGPGFDTPEQALKSINSPMELNIVVWNEVALNFYVQGRYYFNISEREIEMEARPKVGETDITYTVYFDTNLGLNGSDGRKLEYEWQSSGSQTSSYFDITVNYVDKTITFHALSENVGSGSGDRLDIVTLTSENIGFTVKINQEAFRLDYELLCASTEVHGKYVEDVSLNYTNYITVKVRTNGSDFHGERYEIQTEEKNGIYFRAEGTFDSSEATALGDGNYEYDIKLDGFGTPVKENIADEILKSFDVKITSNSVSNAYCESTIVIGYKSRKILTIGSNASYLHGYMLEPGTASRTFVDASINFGTSQNSTVNMEENESGNAFTIEIITEGQGMAGGQIDYTYLKNKINTFKPDIILTGYYVNYYTVGNGTEVIGLLSDFVDAGGVFLMISEYYPDLNSVNAMVGEIIPGATGDKQDIGLDQAFVIQSVDDPVTQGPFGDMRGQKWGADGHEMYGFENLPANTIIYSSTTSSPGRACMFRHAEKPFFFIGDGGFISNPQRYLGDSYQGSYVYCPFAIDRNYRQVSRKNYTSTMNVEVFNSAIFGNILTWAVDYAETYGIEYPEVGNKFP